jgi:holo-[acyl-carrier protein] synthase
MERWQARFLERVFTPEELAYALGRRDPAEHLAARFAAKEATLKARGTGLSMGVRWREMEVRQARGGPPTLFPVGQDGRHSARPGGCARCTSP